MFTFDPQAFGTGFAPFLAEARLPALDEGTPDPHWGKLLEKVTVDSAFAPAKVRSPEHGRACLAGLWLRFDFLDRSHHISQELAIPEGSYWHGIMHRREGDFANASYWFRRVGQHPLFEPLGREGASLLSNLPKHDALKRLAEGGVWDPHRFVDLCKACVVQKLPIEEQCKQVQRLEWEMLFAYCHDRAKAG